MLYCQVAFPLPVRQNFSYCWLPEQGSPAPQVGARVRAWFGRQGLQQGWVVGTDSSPPPFSGPIKPLVKVMDPTPLFGQELLDLAQWLADLYFSSLGEALAAMLPSGQRPRELEEWPEIPSHYTRIPHLSGDQARALGQWESGPPISYLFGVTGSGKTEVFLRAAEQVLEAGRGVIYLVPEISLAQHYYQQLSHRFGSQLALLHSQLTVSQRLRQWQRIQQGQAQLVLGARSAVFAPLPKLGLIIIDEEHESSYKSSKRPRYHARQVAMYRIRKQNARLLLGSATPSLECWHAMNVHALQKLRLPARIAGYFPKIEVVDLNQHRHALLAPPTMLALEDCGNSGHQAVIFLNQRGFARSLHCYHCRQSIHCPQCSVALTVYQQQGLCRCHHCGHHRSIPLTCPQCGGTALAVLGAGTERLQQQLQLCFPHRNIVRMDGDTTSKRGSGAAILSQLERGKIDILLGTQMVIKGLHFPNIQLVIIVQADGAINLPEFRASERCFSQLIQAAGRAGRCHRAGRVLLQTYQPQHPLMKAAASGRIDLFYEQELAQRRLFSLPPFSRFFRILFTSSDQQVLEQAMDRWAELLQEGPWSLFGPTACALAKIANRYRGHILLGTNTFNRAHARLVQLQRQHPPPARLHMEWDCDPLELL